MSFSVEVKQDLADKFSNKRHCNLAELSAIVNICCEITPKYKKNCLKIQSENFMVIKKCFTLLKKTFKIDIEIKIRHISLKKNKEYMLFLKDINKINDIINALGLKDVSSGCDFVVNPLVLTGTCCKRTFLRGNFLACGSLTDPNKTYHLEFATQNEVLSKQIKGVLDFFDLDAKIVKRKGYFVVYIKEAEKISDLLNIIEAHNLLMEFENVRILKDIRNGINRKVNFETSNINKTVLAAVKQKEQIDVIKNSIGLKALPENLQELAILRLKFPEASLKELGQMTNPPIGKSGVNHRLKKIELIASDLKS